MITLGRWENQKPGKESRGESKAETGNRGPIWASSSEISPTSPRVKIKVEVNNYGWKWVLHLFYCPAWNTPLVRA